MSYLLAVTAAIVNALVSVLQRIGVESAPSSAALRLSLMAHAVRRRIWLVGFALMLVEFGLQATPSGWANSAWSSRCSPPSCCF